MLAMACCAAKAQTTYTWTGTAGDGDWSNTANWDAEGMPVDALPDSSGSSRDVGLTFNNPYSRIVFSATSLPTKNIPKMGGTNNGSGHTPTLQFDSGGAISIEAGSGLRGIVTQSGVTRDIYIVGDGAGAAGTNEGVILNVALKGELNRHTGRSTHNFVVNSDGILNFQNTAWSWGSLTFSGSTDRYATFEIAGGEVNIESYITGLTRLADNYVKFTAPGGTFTAAFGGDFADIDAVNTSIGIGVDFQADGDIILVATDNGDGTFTVKPAGSESFFTWKGSTNGDWNNAANWTDNNNDGTGDIPPTNASGFLSDRTIQIIIENGPNQPASNIPGFDGDADGTPHFILQDGASLNIPMADVADGPSGAGFIAKLGTGSSLTWTSVDSMTLAFASIGIQSYEISGGTFTIQTPSFDFCETVDGTSSFTLDGGTLSIGATEIHGAQILDPGDDFGGQPNSVVLENNATFTTTAMLAGDMQDSSGNPTLVFDIRDTISSVTAKLGGAFPDVATVQKAVGGTFVSSTLGDKLIASDNGDGTFTVRASPIYTWIGDALDGDWTNAANWMDIDGDGSGDLPPVDGSGNLTGSGNWIVIQGGQSDPSSSVPAFAGGAAGTPRFEIKDGAWFDIEMAASAEGPSGVDTMVSVTHNSTLTWSATSMVLARQPVGTQVYDIAGDFEIGADRLDFGFDASRLSYLSVHDGGMLTLANLEVHGTHTPGGDFSGGASVVSLDGASSVAADGAVFQDMFDAAGNPTLVFDFRDKVSSLIGAFGGDFPDIDAVNAACGKTFVCLSTYGGRPEATDNGDGTFTVLPVSTFFWTGAAGDGDWTNPGNWLGGTLPPLREGALTGDYTADWNTITIRNTGTGPSVNIPPFDGGSGGTPKFFIEAGASLEVAEADGITNDYGGPVGNDVLVEIGAGASLTWTDAQSMMLMRHPPNSLQSYNIDGGAFHIVTPTLTMGNDANRTVEINLDAGSMQVSADTINGCRKTNLDYSGSANQVNLSNHSSFTTNGVLNLMEDSAGNPTVVFDLRDEASSVTAAFGGSFADLAAVQAAIGKNFDSTEGLAPTASDNGDGTFTVSVGGVVEKLVLEALGFGIGDNPAAFYMKASGLDPAKSYILRRSTALDGTDWTDVGIEFTPTGTEADLSDDTPPAGKAFYRVEDAP
jgi:hypothetical protein